MENLISKHTLLNLKTHRTLWILLAFFFLLSCDTNGNSAVVPANEQAAKHNQATTDSTFVILALGDSLTEGLGVAKKSTYPALLEQALHAQGMTQIKVINSGLSGETSSGLFSRLDWALKLEPDLTILNIGANDAMRGLPLELTSKNISNIIMRIQASGSAVILAGMQIYDNLGREYVTGFKDMYPHLAAKHDLPMIPFFLQHVAGQVNFNQDDMIHPTAEGYAVIVERNVLPVVLDQLKDQDSEQP